MKFSIPKFSFFEIFGCLTLGTTISNYLLDKPLMNTSALIIYFIVSAIISGLGLYSNFKKKHKANNC